VRILLAEDDDQLRRRRLDYSLDVKVDGKDGIEEVWVDARTGELVSMKHEG